MSEMKERNLKHGAPVAAEDKMKTAEEAAETRDDRENAPVEASVPAAEENVQDKSAGKKKSRKKRRKNGVALPLAAVLLAISLIFGVVVGYGVGRSVGAERLKEAEARLAELTAALESSQSTPVYDAFSEELSAENQAALEDLAGDAFDMADESSVLLGEDGFDQAADGAGAESAVVVAEYDGGQLMSDEVAREYSEQMTNFVFAGYNEDEIAETLLDEVLRYMVSDRVLEAHAREMGLYELNDEDRAKIEEQAEHSYAEQMEFYRDFVNTEGMTDEEANGAVKAYLQENEGVTLESIRAELESGWWAQKIYDEITKDVSVDEADLQAAYDDLLARQKESFAAYPDDFEFAQMNGETIAYNLDGYRAVRMLLFTFEDSAALEAVPVLTEEMGELDPATDAEMIAGYRAEIDAYYAPVEAKAREALDRMERGERFAALLDELGQDAGMKDEALRKTGYYVSEKSLLWPQEMISAAMALENSGDISGVVRMSSGVCILEYVGEVAAGEVALEDVRESLMRETLESAQYNAYEAQMNQWLEEANAVYYPERMQ